MARRRGEISLARAAARLECHYDTVRAWAHRCLAGERSPINYVRRDITGHYWLSSEEIAELSEREAQTAD